MKVLVSGDRDYKRGDLIYAVLAGIHSLWTETAHLDDDHEFVVIEGEARGADTLAREAAEKLGFDVEPYPAKWQEHDYEGISGIKCWHKPSPGRCPAAGPRRNKQMLDEGQPNVVLCFHDDFENSKGTKNMAEQAKRSGLPVYVISRY